MSARTDPVFACVDIGASGGRVIAGLIENDTAVMDVVHSFENGPIDRPDGLHWCVEHIFDQIVVGLTAVARRHGNIASIGIDTWAVDYSLLDSRGQLLAEPFSYRDGRGTRGAALIHERIEPTELYTITGLQFLPFNTIYQLAVEDPDRWTQVSTIVLLPDLLAYWLTGQLGTEITNASTTGLFDAHARDWSQRLLELVGVERRMLPPLTPAGSVRGPLLPEIADRIGVDDRCVLTAVGSHDTASAVAAVPATRPGFGYLSCGTWSLVGVETHDPIITEKSRLANFTNEAGIDGRIRYLRNEGGLWLLQESLRHWDERRDRVPLDELLTASAALPTGGPQIDVRAEEFIPPGDMPDRIIAACRRTAQPEPVGKAGLVRCILDSLAAAFGRAIREATELSGQPIDRLHIVGGGGQNALLCQLTADACGCEVISGPTEATALGNLLVQARAQGVITGTLEDLRAVAAASTEAHIYQPSPDQSM